MFTRALCLLGWLGLASAVFAADPLTVALDSTDKLTLVNVKAEVVEHRGRKCVRLTSALPAAGPRQAPPGGGQGKAGGAMAGPGRSAETLAILTGSEFHDGTIEIEVAGEPVSNGADGMARGFVGLAFRVDAADPEKYEAFYIRPTNGRADDQVRRNHSAQYISHPGFPWFRLREEFPSMYESYVDLSPGEWTRLKIVVEGTRARLFVDGADQPCLIVNDLKRGDTTGAVALWTEPTTISHFRDLVVTPKADTP